MKSLKEFINEELQNSNSEIQVEQIQEDNQPLQESVDVKQNSEEKTE